MTSSSLVASAVPPSMDLFQELHDILAAEQLQNGLKGIDFYEPTIIILESFVDVIQKPRSVPLSDNGEYMALMELFFLIRNLRELSSINLYQAQYKVDKQFVTNSSKEEEKMKMEWNLLDRKELANRVRLYDRLLVKIRSYSNDRLLACHSQKDNGDKPLPFPRIVSLCQEYAFNEREKDLFTLMVVAQGSHRTHVLNSLTEEDLLRKMLAYQRLSCMSEVEVDLFCDGDRMHMKENLVTVDEENGTQFNLRVQRVAVQLLYGRKIKADDLLKISQTSLEGIILDEQATLSVVSKCEGFNERKRTQADESDAEESEEDEDEDDEEEDSTPASPSLKTPSYKLVRTNSGSRLPTKSAEDTQDSPALTEDDNSTTDKSRPSKSHSLINTTDVVESTSESLRPYTKDNQLEYLEDSFQLIALMIKGNVARMKDDLKKEGTSRYNSTWGDQPGDLKHSKRELTAKLRLQESRIQQRLANTAAAGLPAPRLESLMQRFQLDSFEKRIILLLIGKTVSPIVRTLLETLDTSNRVADDVLTVGQSLSILCQDFNMQIANRCYFYQSSRLMKNAVISLHKLRWHAGTGDLTENKIMLDRRILDWVVGLDSEINELVEGSDLYEPCVDLTQVVLPDGYGERIMSQCAAYGDFQAYRKRVGLAERLSYGNSLVILLWGKSGTGKTMTVNAVAHALGKKVLLVDFNSLVNKKDSGGGGDFDVELKGLFRESAMNNAVLFFDECETIFRSRSHGSDRTLNSLLTEMERYEGIVFMATNRPYEIDEAMHRRITMVLEYREPDSSMRKQIWDSLLGLSNGTSKIVDEAYVASLPLPERKTPQPTSTGLASIPKKNSSNGQTTDDPAVAAAKAALEKSSLCMLNNVDTAFLSTKYQLTGGFIKNALLSAMLSALSRNHSHPVITQTDLVEGCKMQMRGNLSQRAFEDRVPLKQSLDSLYLTDNHCSIVKKIIRHEKSRAQVYGAWCMPTSNSDGAVSVPRVPSHTMRENACITLLAGNRGSGKSTIVTSVAHELGDKRLKWLHVSDFINQSILDVSEVLRLLVKDATIMDAVIVLDGFEHILEDPSGGDSGGGGHAAKLHLLLSRMMDILYEFHGAIFLLAHIENPQNIVLQRDFGSRLFAFLRLIMPTSEIRTNLWRTLMPPGAPLAKDIDYQILGRRFELFAGSIQSAISNAACEVASRVPEKQIITQKDLMAAGEYEIAKFKNGNFEMMSSLFS